MFTEAKNWKWMVPAVGLGVFLLLTRALLLSSFEGMRWFGLVPGLAAVVCGLAAIGNYIDYRRAQSLDVLERRKNALTQSQLSVELAAARGVHPEAVKTLINERHRVWMLKAGHVVEDATPHSVLYGAPEVTEFFLLYFLQHSSDVTVMPKRSLVDGRKNRFDPWGAVTEYVMYDKLISLLERQGKIQRWNEFSAYEWVDPWTPKLVAEDYGLEWEEAEEEIRE